MIRIMLASFFLTMSTWAVASGQDFKDKDLSGKMFTSESFNGADFSGATLKQVVFLQCSLKNAKFNDANIASTSFRQSDASGASFVGGTPGNEGTMFIRTKLDGANFEGVRKSLAGLNFSDECSLKKANLKGTKISHIRFSCDLAGAELQGANLRTAFHSNSPPRLTGAHYDDNTAFPEGFEPKNAGMILKKAEEKKKEKE